MSMPDDEKLVNYLTFLYVELLNYKSGAKTNFAGNAYKSTTYSVKNGKKQIRNI